MEIGGTPRVPEIAHLTFVGEGIELRFVKTSLSCKGVQREARASEGGRGLNVRMCKPEVPLLSGLRRSKVGWNSNMVAIDIVVWKNLRNKRHLEPVGPLPLYCGERMVLRPVDI